MNAPAERIDVLPAIAAARDMLATHGPDGVYEVMNNLTRAGAAVAELIEKLEQIERLSRTANRDMVDVPAMLGDIARAALARVQGGQP